MRGFPKIFCMLIFLLLALLNSACSVLRVSEDKLPWRKSQDILFHDSFSSNMTGWTTTVSPLAYADYQAGGFRIAAYDPGFFVLSRIKKQYTDVLISVQAINLSESSNNAFGVFCRLQDEENFYAFVISSDGYYGISLMQAGELINLSHDNLDYSEVIRKDDGFNEIWAECNGGQLSLFVNGTFLTGVTDATLKAGDVGVFAASYDENGGDMLFDNFIVVKR